MRFIRKRVISAPISPGPAGNVSQMRSDTRKREFTSVSPRGGKPTRQTSRDAKTLGKTLESLNGRLEELQAKKAAAHQDWLLHGGEYHQVPSAVESDTAVRISETMTQISSVQRQLQNVGTIDTAKVEVDNWVAKLRAEGLPKIRDLDNLAQMQALRIIEAEKAAVSKKEFLKKQQAKTNRTVWS